MPARTWRLALSPSVATPDNASRTHQRVSALPSVGHPELLQYCIMTRGVSWLKSVSRRHLNCPIPYAAPTGNDVQTKVFVSVVCGFNAASLGPSRLFSIRLSSVWSILSAAWVVVNPVVDLLPSDVQHRLAPQSIRRFLLVAFDRVHFSITRALPNCEFSALGF